MKINSTKKIPIMGCLILTGVITCQATIIADWTFETSQPTTAGPFSPETGSGSALGYHDGSATYSSPAGNGSFHSFSSTGWSVGDYWQFQVNTIGYNDITLSWDQTSSSTGPEDFILEYSINGTVFTPYGSPYTVLENASPNPTWNTNTFSNHYTFSTDLSSIISLDNSSTVYFRLVDTNTTSENGGTVSSVGADRVDNFIVSGDADAPVPELAETGTISGVGLLILLGLDSWRRRKAVSQTR